MTKWKKCKKQTQNKTHHKLHKYTIILVWAYKWADFSSSWASIDPYLLHSPTTLCSMIMYHVPKFQLRTKQAAEYKQHDFTCYLVLI